MRTRRLSTRAGDYRLWASLPEGAAPAAGFPVVWVLDGASVFPIIAETARRLQTRPDATGVDPVVIIGVDHEPTEKPRRYVDYMSSPTALRDDALRAASVGGADAFLELLTGEARTVAGLSASLDPARQVLLGHSLAGLFTLQAMAARPDAFTVFGAVSPSTWWNPDDLRDRLIAMPDKGQSLFIGAGENEEPASVLTEADARRASRRMVTRAQETADLVGQRLIGPGRVECVIAAHEDHASALIALAPRFLRFALKQGGDADV